jgi:hypothetical protein
VRTERRRGPSRGRGRRVGPSAAAAWSATPHAGGSARTPGHRAGAVPGCTCRPHGCVERSHRSSPVAARPHVGSLRNAGLTGLEVDVTAPHGVPAAGVRATFSDVREPYTPPPWRQALPPRASELVRRTQLPAVSGPNWRDSATDRAPVLSTARSEAREWSAPPHGDAFRETAREPLFSSGSWAATGSRRPPGQGGHRVKAATGSSRITPEPRPARTQRVGAIRRNRHDAAMPDRRRHSALRPRSGSAHARPQPAPPRPRTASAVCDFRSTWASYKTLCCRVGQRCDAQRQAGSRCRTVGDVL